MKHVHNVGGVKPKHVKSINSNSVPSNKDQFRQNSNTTSQSHARSFTETNLSNSNTILASVNGKSFQCLIDTGASINLIDHDWFYSNLPELGPSVKASRVVNARAANGSSLEITGFVVLSLTVDSTEFPTYVNIARNLSTRMILGSQFLNRHGANIDCASRKVKLAKQSIIRVVDKQEIPPLTQSVVCAKLSNKLPVNTVGLCHGGRRVSSLGILIANTASSVQNNNCAHLLVMNTTDEPIFLYPRTKLGTFTLIESHKIHSCPDFEEDSVSVNSVQTPSVDNNANTRQNSVKEVLSKVNLNTDQMSDTEKSEMNDLLTEYIDIFQVKGGPTGNYSGVKHEINTGNHPPIRSRPYRQAPHIQAEVRRQVGEMLEQEVIRESTSPWSFPVCMTPKAGAPNTYRFAIDFRKLNNICARDNFPLPNINDALDSLGSAKPNYFSTLDLASGYWQIGLEESSKAKTAFITQDGLYEFQKMPFGLHNAPATFQRAMQEVLRGLNWKFVLCYLDDVIIFSSSFSEHIRHLRQVFDRFRVAGLKLQPKKCTFGQTKVKYLGHIVSKDGVATDPDKLHRVKNYPTPAKVDEVRSFLGFVGYYRKFIKDFCKIAEPLTNLTRKGVPFVWDTNCQEAFKTLKQKLLEPPILAYPLFDGTDFILQTDASRTGLGFILAQKQDGKERVISYGGRALSNAERNYTVTEIEALAVVEGVKKYAPYLQHSTKFTVVTDHCALKWLFSKKNTTGRVARWALKLQSYNFDVIHVSGRNNGNADALSRIDYSKIGICDDCNHSHSEIADTVEVSQVARVNSGPDKMVNAIEAQNSCADANSCPTVDVVRNLRFQKGKRIENDKDSVKPNIPKFPDELNLDNFKQVLLTDSFAGAMLNYLENDELPDNAVKARNMVLQADQYYAHEGLLYNIWHTPAKRHMPEKNVHRLYIPVQYIDTVLNNCHDHVLAAHFGFQRTYNRIRQRYFWKNMYRDVDNWVRSCISCSQRKTHRHKVLAPLITMKVPNAFERVSVDILGPLPTTVSGNRYVLCFSDHCTRWPILVPLKVTDASTIARALFEFVICEHGCPQTLLSDRGQNFLSKIVLEVCRIMRTHKLNTSSYHPQCNAIQERFNAVILDTISHYANEFQTDWDEYISAIQFAYRTTPAENSVGFSPFFLLYGREARLPIDVTLLSQSKYPDKTLREHIHGLVSQLEVFRNVSKRHAEQNQKKMKERFDDRAQEVQFQVGDCVWIFIPALQQGLSKKLAKFWAGPYLLVEQTSPVNFKVRNLANDKLVKSTVHVNRMKFAYDRFIRPGNDIAPEDPIHRDPIPELVEDDCSDDIFDLPMATQEAEKSRVSIIPGLPPIQDDSQEYVIERIVRGRYKDKRLEYLIKWQNFPNSRNTWEPASNLNAAALEYLKSNPVKITGTM